MSLNTNRSILSKNVPPLVNKSLIINQNRRDFKHSILWGLLHFCILIILVYDMYYMCPFYFTYFHYIEYAMIVILTFNVIYYVSKVLRISLTYHEPITINLEQKKLLGIHDSDPHFNIIKTPTRSPNTTPLVSQTVTPMNMSALSWRSNVSQSDSLNYSISSSWTYMSGSPDTTFPKKVSPKVSNNLPIKSTYQDVTSVETITDEESLEKYLKEHAKYERSVKQINKSQHSSNLLSSFWSHPVTKTVKDMSSFLKKCHYQLATLSPVVKTSCPSSKEDQSASPGQMSVMEVWTRINVDSVALTQWNENLRKWISQTIIERVINEIDRINLSLEKHGLTDIKIGTVGLDRLRKTANMVPISHFIPSLATLIPFLEITANQEYLEKRIRELAKGGCMSEFKWKAGGGYKGKEWDDSLPTDCAIIMHFLSCYLDTQLMPLPYMPDTKAFTGHHYIKANDKMPTLTPSSLFIQEVTERPPHFRVIVGEKVYEMVKGYNNLFHSILFFIYHVNKMEHGMLGRVNLGRAGVNILWVIDQ